MAKLTAEQLRKIVQEEVGKFGKGEDVESVAKKTKEVDADDLANTLEKHVDMMKALKIEESKLKTRLAKIQERKAQLAKLIAK